MILFSITPVNTFRRFAFLILAALVLLKCDFFDITPPDIKFISPSTDTEYFGTIPVELKATDNRGVDRVELFLDGESIYEFSKEPYKTDLDLSQINASTVTLKAVAYDKADNHADASRDISLTLGFNLTSPNDGEIWPEESTQTISWEKSGNMGSKVILSYSIDGGTTWSEIIDTALVAVTYDWTLPNLPETSTDCVIKIVSGGFEDTSGAFTIENFDPVLRGSLNTPGSANDVIVYGNYAYVADGTSGLQIIDISDKSNPSFAGSFDTPGNAVSIFIDGSNAFVVDNVSLYIIEISNPSSPILISSIQIPGSPVDISVQGNFAYVAAQDSGLQIVDISDRSNPLIVASLIKTESGYSLKADNISISGNYAYVPFWLDYIYGPLFIINISDPVNLSEVGSIDLTGGWLGYHQKTVVYDNHIYFSAHDDTPMSSWFGILDIINPASPIYDGGIGVKAISEVINGISVAGDYAYVSYNHRYLFEVPGHSTYEVHAINISNTSAPKLVSYFSLPSNPGELYASGDYLYVADGSSGLLIYDISILP